MLSPEEELHWLALKLVPGLGTRTAGKLLDRFPNAALDDVVSQDHAGLLSVGEMSRQRQRVGDAAFALLVGVVDMFQPELLAVRKKTQEIA